MTYPLARTILLSKAIHADSSQANRISILLPKLFSLCNPVIVCEYFWISGPFVVLAKELVELSLRRGGWWCVWCVAEGEGEVARVWLWAAGGKRREGEGERRDRERGRAGKLWREEAHQQLVDPTLLVRSTATYFS